MKTMRTIVIILMALVIIMNLICLITGVPTSKWDRVTIIIFALNILLLNASKS